MRKSYIAKSAEALNLHNGTQTAIVVKMKVQPIRVSSGYYDISISKGKYGFCAYGTLISNILKNPLFLRCAPYQIGQEVYVRENWCMPDDEYFYKANGMQKHEHYLWDGVWQSPITMPKQAVRTRFKIVGCEAVRVKDDIGYGNATKILEFDYSEGQQFKNYAADWDMYNNSQFQFGDYRDSWQSYIISRFGQSAWDNNDYIWYYTIEKI